MVCMITALSCTYYMAGGTSCKPGVDLMIIWVDDVGGGGQTQE